MSGGDDLKGATEYEVVRVAREVIDADVRAGTGDEADSQLPECIAACCECVVEVVAALRACGYDVRRTSRAVMDS